MDTRELEAVVRSAWAGSQLPLTNEVLGRLSGLPRSDIEHGMRALMRKGVVDMDVGTDGAIQWCVRGVKREAPPPPPPPRAEGAVEVVALAPSVSPPASVKALPVAERVPAPKTSVAIPGTGLRLEVGPDRKSLLMSGGLSLVFGPFGWMYAGPWKEVVPGIIIYVGLVALLPKFLIGTLLGLLHPTCGVFGTLYAWRYNKLKERVPLLLVDNARRQ